MARLNFNSKSMFLLKILISIEFFIPMKYNSIIALCAYINIWLSQWECFSSIIIEGRLKMQRLDQDNHTMTSICIKIHRAFFAMDILISFYWTKPDLSKQVLKLIYNLSHIQPLQSQHYVISSCCQYWLTVDYGGQPWSKVLEYIMLSSIVSRWVNLLEW